MLNRLFTIVVTLLCIGLSDFAFGSECRSSAEEDVTWLNSQPMDPKRTQEDQSLYNQKVSAYLKSSTCRKDEGSEVIEGVINGNVDVADGIICASDAGDRVTLRLNNGQTVVVFCQRFVARVSL